MTISIYARTSTIEQNVEQQAAYLADKYKHDTVVMEQASGKNVVEREQLVSLVSGAVAGDTIIVQDISRIGRNTVEVMQLVEDLQTKDVKLIIDDLGSIDITSSAGKMILTTLAAVATMQREQMLEKQAIGIARAKEEGKFKGKQRTQATTDKFNKVQEYVEKGLAVDAACKAAGLGRATYYRMVKESK